MKVLVTGGAGYIGSILVRRLLEARHDVVVVDRLSFGGEPLAELEGRPGYRLVTGDIRDHDLVDALVGDAEAVVHLAAIVGEAACGADPRRAIETNVEATRHLAESSAAAGIARFVFASTCSVYGTGLAGRLSEESALAPAELYAESRVNAEHALTRVTGARFRPTVLRFGTVYGYSPRTRFDLVVNLLTARALRDGAVSIFGGEQWRPFVHVADVARAIQTSLEADLDRVGGQTLNVGDNRENYQMKDLGPVLTRAIPGTEVRVVPEVVDRRSYYVVFDKIERLLGFHAGHDVAQGVGEVRDAIRSGRIPDPTDRRLVNFRAVSPTDGPAAAREAAVPPTSPAARRTAPGPTG
ncbi:MAG: NAD-dependent epimerase/dehydratase family protein [Candidatus Eiseniibacteriota bacterium]